MPESTKAEPVGTDPRLRVLFATAELAPLARVGGLAEATAGLVRALRAAGVEVEIVLPDYGPEYWARATGTGDLTLADETVTDLDTPWWVGPTQIRRGVHSAVGPITLVRTSSMARPHPYVDDSGEGWPDNDERFMGFAAAVAQLAADEGPDLVHLNDWHTAAAVAFLDQMVAERPPTVLTIHTLGYQGVCDRGWLQHLGPEAYRFAWYDATNPLAGAIEMVDRVIAVSPNYASEILTPEAGMGLDDRLGRLGDRLVGIRNGIDTARWDPAIDTDIAVRYTVTDRSGKAACRAALAAEAGWDDGPSANKVPVAKVPIAGVVTRLVEQKGVDILIDALRFAEDMPLRLAILGSGSADLAAALRQVADDQPDRVWFVDGFDEALAHRIFAGSDLFVMPSRFEPCGLAQMQAMAYGTIPVVTDVGGLHDTVIDADRERTKGTGFLARSVDTAGLVDALHRGVRALRHSSRRRAIQDRGMSSDWSWQGPAAAHIEIYRDIL